MPKFNILANLVVTGLDEEDAIYNYDQIKNLFGIADVECLELKEIEE